MENDLSKFIIDYLADSGNPDKIRELNNWLDAGEENRRLFEDAKRVWEASRQLPPEPFDMQSGWNRLNDHITQPAPATVVPMKPGRTWWKVAAVVLPLMALAGYWWMKGGDGEWVSYTAHHTVKDSLRLPDGSDVFLRPGATVQYKINNRERSLRLTAGEAFFKISQDAQRQFSIAVPKGVVKVLGTSFNISTSAGFSDVTVWDGKVSVEGNGKKVILTAGNMAVVNAATGDVKQPEGNFAYRCGWGNSDLSFSNQSLQVVLETLASYYRVDLETNDKQLRESRITVRFSHMPLDEALTVLAEMLDLQIQRRSDTEYELIRK
ncbi:FecR domain-containing protein [Chitinophaga deserti]|uniref:FecR domain-containing protein n=1 Tax=Chitinophaga deserti TaxID=2164099 RepID=UPI000D6CA7E5|nr:FecR domain-containing protein [Chitinophaga deserti]